MNNTARLICYLVALILFVVETVRTKSLVSAGLAAWVLVNVVDTADNL